MRPNKPLWVILGTTDMLNGYNTGKDVGLNIQIAWSKHAKKVSLACNKLGSLGFVKELIDSPENLRRKKHRKHCVDSMINRLRNKGFVKFNSDTKFWHNLCRSRQSTDA